MKKLALAIVLLLPLSAAAQVPGPQTPEAVAQEQLERLIGNLVVTNTNLGAQLAAARTTIVDLQKKLADLQKPKDPAKKE